MSGLIDITAFDAIKESEQGYDLEMKATDGSGTGIIFTVIGRYSEAVQKYSSKLFSEYQREQDIAKRKGKDLPPKTSDDLQALNLEGAVIRVIGWKNVKQEFSSDIVRTVLKKNPHWVTAIIEESDNIGNFTKAL